MEASLKIPIFGQDTIEGPKHVFLLELFYERVGKTKDQHKSLDFVGSLRKEILK